MRRVLVIAHDFPPMGGGGVMRVLKFTRYLPEFGWTPTVITVPSGAYDRRTLDPTLLADVPPEVAVHRVWYPSRFEVLNRLRRDDQWKPGRGDGVRVGVRDLVFRMAVPDMEVMWRPFALARIRAVLRQTPHDLVFTTSPPNSLHLIGQAVRARHGLPWIMDFRDMWGWRADLHAWSGARRARERSLEQSCLASADAVVCATEPIARGVREQVGEQAVHVVLNGYDPADFPAVQPPAPGPMILAYVGSCGPSRSPLPLLEAFRAFVARHGLTPAELQLRFVGPIHEGAAIAMIEDDPLLRPFVTLRGFVPHQEAVREMCAASALLLITSAAEGGDTVLTGKVFEYVAARRPVLAMVPEHGAAAELVREADLGVVAPSEQPAAIAAALERLFTLHRAGELGAAFSFRGAARFDRREQARALAEIFEEARGAVGARS